MVSKTPGYSSRSSLHTTLSWASLHSHCPRTPRILNGNLSSLESSKSTFLTVARYLTPILPLFSKDSSSIWSSIGIGGQPRLCLCWSALILLTSGLYSNSSGVEEMETCCLRKGVR